MIKFFLSDQRPGWAPWVAGLSLLANTFVVVTVNLNIYKARADFIEAHPEYVANQPPTISRALSDPAIGDGFAFWIAISAVLLFLGVCGLIATFATALPAVRAVSSRGARRLTTTLCLVPPMQLAACVGMVMLSQYTFPHHNEAHMMGSYIFFASQAATVLTGLLLSRAIAKDQPMARAMADVGVYSAGANRVRLWVGMASVVLVLSYLVLFVVKDFDLGAWEPLVYLIYVSTEPLCISSFLLFVLLYNADLARAARSRRAVEQGA
ncbi:hypothetical protein [Psychromarinibacter sp. S121]|uniref:hypothetical protein n=1 Tax=Psychromarinibacter sp. S121 TaxID=3415127 RepID=UPI003C79775A